MIMEIALGAAALSFLWQGINVAPLLFLTGMSILLYILLNTRNGFNSKNFSVIKSENQNLVKFEQIGGQETAKKNCWCFRLYPLPR